MANLERNSWPLGWIPSDDANHGRKEGLLRMDNLTLDQKGALSLIPGTKKISSGAFGSTIYNIYSRYLDGKKLRYVHSGTNILRNYGGAASSTVFDLGFLSGGNAQYSAFGSGFGHVFACSGAVKRKDDGTIQSDLGLEPPPGLITLSVNTPPDVNVSGKSGGTFILWDATAIENTTVYNQAGDYVEADTDATSFRAIMQRGLGNALSLDATDISGTGTHTDNDLFSAVVRVTDTSSFIKLRIEFMLQAPTAPGYTTDTTDYYWHEWKTEEFRQGINVWNTLNCRRSDFERQGNDNTLSWATVKGIRVIFIAAAYQDSCVFADAKFEGGNTGSLEGNYEYIQVNVSRNDTYVEISPRGLVSDLVSVKQSSINVTPYAIGPTVNEVWIYRRGGTDGTFRGVAIRNDASPFDDTVSDADLLLNTPGFDERYTTLNSFLENVPDNIVGMEGPFFGRMIYITQSGTYVSEPNCPSVYDTRHVYENGSANGGSEINLWISKVSEAEILIGTTQDIYSFRGRGEENEDGSLLDFTLSPLGIKQPPIGNAVAVEGNSVLYHASDGWRVLAGSSSELVTKELDVFYRGDSAHGIDKVRVEPNNAVFSSCCYGKGRILLCVEHITNGRLIHSYNTITKTWELPYFGASLGPMGLFTEEDGTVICACDTDKYLRELFVGTLIDETTKLPVKITSAFDNNGLPFNRKDTTTFKLVADSGNDNVTVILRCDGSATDINLGTLAFNGKEEKYIKIRNTVGKKKSFQLELTGTFGTFVLYSFGIEHEVLPKQEAILRVPNNNLGTTHRKRLVSFPVVMDCLGNSVTITPAVDDVNTGTPLVINNDGKKTQRVFFTTDVIGTDVGALIESASGYFELYDIPWGEAVYEQLPLPMKYLRTPETNFGIYAYKQFNNIPFMANTRGGTITVVPILDGVAQTAQTFTSTYKKTHIYQFPTDVRAIDVALQISSDSEFEFYEILKPQMLEVMPELVNYLRITPNNYGAASKKRLRVIPLTINTFGADVVFTPIVDGVSYSPTTFNTTRKQTVFYYFTYTTDVFGIDISGTLDGTSNFEFFGLEKPELVEVLPVGKRYDQYGPIEFDRQGLVRTLSFNILAEGTQISYKIFREDTLILTSSFVTSANKQSIYTLSMPKGINASVLRIELYSSSVFYVLDARARIAVSGNDTDLKTVRLKAGW